MMREGVSRLLWVFIILIIVMVVAFVGYFVYDYFFEEEIIGEDTPKEKQDSEAVDIIEEGEGEGYGEGGGAGEGGNAGGGESGDGGEGSEGLEGDSESSELEEGYMGEDVEPTATLRLLSFDYEIVENDLVEVTSISYSVYNLNVGPMELELLLFIYDEEDDDSKKGVVRDQIYVGMFDYGETITDTSSVSAYYTGDLETEKIFKATLIGYLSDQSYNLGSVSEEVLFE